MRLFAWLEQWRSAYLADLNGLILSRKVIRNKATRTKLERQGWPKGRNPIVGSDTGSIASMSIMEHWASALPGRLGELRTSQKSGATYESLLVKHLNIGFQRLGNDFGIAGAFGLEAAQVKAISTFDQYSHLATIEAKLESDPGLENVFGRNITFRQM